MRVAFVCSEVAPWSKTCGLGDVCGALPAALQAAGEGELEIAVFTPLYQPARAVLEKRGEALEDTGVDSPLGPGLPSGRWFALRRADLPTVFFLDAPALYDRDGVYGGDASSAYGAGGYADNAARYAALCRAAVAGATALLGGVPDVLHAHDWQAGLVAALAKTLHPRPAVVLTIHNLAHQGAYTEGDARAAGVVPGETPDAFWSGSVLNLLAGAIATADRVTTVSPGYAREITQPEMGMGLDGLLGYRGVTGVVNGLDIDDWNPDGDAHIATSFSADAPEGKAACRRALLREVGLRDEPGVPVLGVVSRFAAQKGLDIVADLVPRLSRLPARLVVLGTGDSALEDRFRALSTQHGDHLAALVKFDIGLAHRVVAGCDMLLVPSRFEPCGLTQLQAMRYGSVPVVHAVGGLADTVSDPGDAALARGEGTGFAFRGLSTDALFGTLERAVHLYRQDPVGWRALTQAGLRRDSSWGPSAQAWLRVYREALEAR